MTSMNKKIVDCAKLAVKVWLNIPTQKDQNNQNIQNNLSNFLTPESCSTDSAMHCQLCVQYLMAKNDPVTSTLLPFGV